MKNLKKYNTFGEHLRILRENQGLTLKEVATSIDIDISLLAKIERNERQPKRSLIKNISSYFKIDEKSLLNELLSDQIAYKIINEDADLKILKVAEKKIKYRTLKNL
ncbi:MAG: helix-turn-helix domain-containing protein [Chitinophagaceae bacterium]|nr:helix-turn-helix domain-containing protein [Chitinophagaceae bacterium]